jgi:uncharacterized membrane protein YqjE
MPHLLPLAFLLFASLSAMTLALIVCVLFPRPDTRVTAVVTLLLVYTVLVLAPLHFLSPLQSKRSHEPSSNTASHP